MDEDEGFEAMARACIDAGTAVMESGTPELQAIMRVLLVTLGQEVARRDEGSARSEPGGNPRLQH